jgi:hypothetical protein
MSEVVTTREIPGTGVLLKDAPLTNAELDYNFITLVNSKVETQNNLSDLTDVAIARQNLELEIGSDVQAYDPDTANYTDTVANFTGDLQVSGASVLTAGSIGVTVQAYNENTATFDAPNPEFSTQTALGIPAGTTEDRPANFTTGQIRFNTDTNAFEGYYSSDWNTVGAANIFSDDNSTEGYHLVLADQTSGEFLQGYVSPGDLTYDAASGTVSAGFFDATGGLLVSGNTVIDSNGNLSLSTADFSEGTGSITLPSGTTAQRPPNPVAGDIRFNTELNEYETYNGTAWKIMSPTVQKASVTRTFAAGETIEIDLNESVFAPIVGVTKEVPQTNLISGEWEVSTRDYSLHDTAYNTSITPSSSNSDGTFTLGSGSFRNADVGKRVVGNGGEAVILSTDGAYKLLDSFIDTSPISSGSWSLFDLTFDPSEGIKFETASEFSDLSNSTFTRSFNLTSGDTEGLAFSRDGRRMYVASDDHGADEYTLNVPWNLASAFFSGRMDDGANESVFISDDGTDFYTMDLGGDITQYSLSTPYDIDSASRIRSRDFNAHESMTFGDSGSRLYTLQGDTITQHVMSTPWNIDTASSAGSLDVGSEDTYVADIYIDQVNGTRFYILGDRNDTVYEYELSTPWDITSAVYTGDFYQISQSSGMEGLFFSDEGSMYVATNGPDEVYQYTLGSESTVISTKYSSAINTVSGQIDTEYWSDINNMTALDIEADGEIYYAVSTDTQESFDIVSPGSGIRKILRNNNGTFEINSNEVYGGVTWTPAVTNTIHYALQEAMDNPLNRMSGNQLENASDSEYFTLTNTLDLGIVLFLPESANSSPSTNGVRINYDGNVKDMVGVVGDDFEYEHPAPDKILFTSLSSQTENLKIRVV